MKNKKLLTFRDLQKQQRKWVKHNFPNRKKYHPLLGVVEELGELSHAYLKKEQRIRKQDYQEKKRDAVGDIVIFLSDYCEGEGFDFQNIVEKTWEEVRKRDWKKYPNDGLNK